MPKTQSPRESALIQRWRNPYAALVLALAATLAQ